MADASHDRSTPWIAFWAGAVAALAVILLYVAWRSGERGVEVLRAADILPNVRSIGPPRIPDAPRLPDAPDPFRG